MKQAFTDDLFLAHPNLDLPFVLKSDASKHSMGAVLSQVVVGKEVFIGYFNKKFSSSEK